jgi:hypothetical protein
MFWFFWNVSTNRSASLCSFNKICGWAMTRVNNNYYSMRQPADKISELVCWCHTTPRFTDIQKKALCVTVGITWQCMRNCSAVHWCSAGGGSVQELYTRTGIIKSLDRLLNISHHEGVALLKFSTGIQSYILEQGYLMIWIFSRILYWYTKILQSTNFASPLILLTLFATAEKSI